MAAYIRVASTELKVVEEVKRAYHDLCFAQQAPRETRQLQKPLEDVIAVARTKYETGSSKTGLETVLQAQMELARLKIDLVALEQSRRRAQARLAGVLHLPAETPIAALDTLPAENVSDEGETLIGLAGSSDTVIWPSASRPWRRWNEPSAVLLLLSSQALPALPRSTLIGVMGAEPRKWAGCLDGPRAIEWTACCPQVSRSPWTRVGLKPTTISSIHFFLQQSPSR